LFLITLVLSCFGLSPTAQAQPDGGFFGGNTAEGDDALFNNSGGVDNSACGLFALFNNIGGSDNTATGSVALLNNVSGDDNTATGSTALNKHNNGDENTATGFAALFSDVSGAFNTATGSMALASQTEAFNNTATGFAAMANNLDGDDNTATGLQALVSNTHGNNNTATGTQAMFGNTTGGFNTADGWQAMANNTTSVSNVSIGFQSLFHNSTGSNNTANGSQALLSNTTSSGNTASGFQALFSHTTGNFNTALGYQAGKNLTTGSNNIYIGSPGVASESNTTRIGNVQTKMVVAGVFGSTASGGVPVVINVDGHLGTMTSSARFKDEIKPMDKLSEAILALKPVTFRYKKEIDPEGIPQFGLVAEDVQKVNPDLVVRDAKGQVYTVRYEAVTAMLLNEFLKEHPKVQEIGAAVSQLEKEMDTLTAELREHAAQIQKVSAQLELSKPAPQTVVNNQ